MQVALSLQFPLSTAHSSLSKIHHWQVATVQVATGRIVYVSLRIRLRILITNSQLNPTCVACATGPIVEKKYNIISNNITSSTKPELHNVLQDRQRKTNARPLANMHRKILWSVDKWFRKSFSLYLQWFQRYGTNMHHRAIFIKIGWTVAEI